jgi:hypothetical protein
MPTRAEMEARIRQLAAERGLNPDRWAKIVGGESGWNPAARNTNAKEDSGGLLQLNTKNGVGVEALKAGINPHDPKQWEQQAIFGLDYAKKHGDHFWTVARKLDGKQAPAASPPRRPDGAPGPRDATPVLPADPGRGLLASIYEPFQKLATEQKEQQAEQQLAAAVAQAANQPPSPQPQPAPPAPAALPADFAALMLPRIRRGLLGDDSYGLLS